MTPEYKQRREAKHAAQAAKPHSVNMDLETIDLCLRIPRLSWLSGKTHKQGNGGRKNQSRHAEEHARANIDNANPYQGPDGKWYWYDETERSSEVGYETRAAALVALNDYCKWLNTPEEIEGSE